MNPRVTAIVVARNGAARLERTLAALQAQTRRPDAVVLVDVASRDATASMLAAYPDALLVSARREIPFREAVDAALGVVPPTESEWIWLLGQDTAPAPDALAALLATTEVAASIAIAGPKLLSWDEPDYVARMASSVTRFGASVRLIDDELDQGQRDTLSDVLAVDLAGMLVRRDLYTALGGTDPALGLVDAALDLCIRARLAGYRVNVVPGAAVVYAADGIVGPQDHGSAAVRRHLGARERYAQLHRRLAYAPAAAVPLHWLSLLPLALLRMLWQLLRKRPGLVIGEATAAVTALVLLGRVARARRRIARTRTARWRDLRSLRIPLKTVRRQRAEQREMLRSILGRGRSEVGFITGGGGWTVVAATFVGLVTAIRFVGSSALTGGGLLPLDSSVRTLWQHTGFGVQDGGLSGPAPADPFAYVLAILGSITAWAPSLSVLLLWAVAIPLAALAGWAGAARLTDRPALRVLGGVLWAAAPPFVTALSDGRIGALVAHLALPWLVLAALSTRRSWSAAATAGLLLAVVTAGAPSLLPLAAAAWLVALVLAGRAIARVIAVALPTAALFAPLAVYHAASGTPLGLLADPGPALPDTVASGGKLLLGFPGTGDLAAGGWAAVLADLGVGGGVGAVALLVVAALTVLLAFFALLGPFAPHSRRSAAALLLGLGGLVTAALASGVRVTSVGETAVSIWPGAGLSVLWLGLIASAIGALEVLRRLVPVVAAVLSIVGVAAAAPLGVAAAIGGGAVTPTATGDLPAIVAAQASTDPDLGTLVLRTQSSGAIAAAVERGTGDTLDARTTAESTSLVQTAARTSVAALVADAVSSSSADPTTAARTLGVDWILLADPERDAAGTVTASARAAQSAARVALDANGGVQSVGRTDLGVLWRIDAGSATGPTLGLAADRSRAVLIWTVQAVVVGIVVLLAIPTGSLGDREVRVARRRRTAWRAESPTRRPAGAPGPAGPSPARSSTMTQASTDGGDHGSTERA